MSSSIKPWFEYPALINNYIIDLVLSELNSVRPGLPKNHLKTRVHEMGEAGLGADSLELINLSTALARAIHMQESKIADNFITDSTLTAWIKIARSSLRIYSEKVSFKTSGSTGLKKYCEHFLKNLEEEATFISTLFAGRKRILRAVPSHHIYGFILSVLLPRHLDIEVLDVCDLSINAINTHLKSGDLILGFPELWRSFSEANLEFVNDVIGVNSSGACLQEVGLSLLELNLKSFYEVYGASETAGVGWRNYPLDDYTLFPYWNKHTTEQQLIRESAQLTVAKLQDKLEWTSNIHFKVLGRKDDIVQVGGNNVSLNHVSQMLLQHPSVKVAAIRLMLPNEGSRLKAFVVPVKNGNDALTIEKLEAYVNTCLKPEERPKSIILGRRLPINELGKLCDWSITVDSNL